MLPRLFFLSKIREILTHGRALSPYLMIAMASDLVLLCVFLTWVVRLALNCLPLIRRDLKPRRRVPARLKPD